jgi:heme-degrading monooxygenase HmoA
VLVVTRFVVEEADQPAFAERARAALEVLAARPGYRDGRLARAVDDVRNWCLIVDWDTVGSYRRALSSYEVKVHATPLLAESLDEPSAYEVLASAGPGGAVETTSSDRSEALNRPLPSRS